MMKCILLLLNIALLGCSSNKKQEPISKSGVPVINLSEDVSTVPSLLLSESAEKLEIVSLEMTDQSMLGEIRRIQVTDHNIWIDHGREFYIYRFSRSGKFLNKIGSIGQGPGEYTTYSTFLVDEDKKEVYIFSTNIPPLNIYYFITFFTIFQSLYSYMCKHKPYHYLRLDYSYIQSYQIKFLFLHQNKNTESFLFLITYF